MQIGSLRTWGPVLAGPLAGGLVWMLPAPAGMPPSAHAVAGLAAWMAVWWLTAVMPLAVTALLPLALLPLITPLGIDRVSRPYADPIIFLFLGGFFLAAATERWALHRRLALAVIGAVGTEPRRLVLGLMLATGFASMWISNTATAVMMLPLASVLGAFLGSYIGSGNPDRPDNNALQLTRPAQRPEPRS